MLAVALSLLLAGAAHAETIGLSLPYSGRYAPLAKQIEIGVLKAIEDHVRQGGRRPEIAPVDDGCSDERTAENVAQLRERKAVVVIGLPCFDPAFAIANAFAADGVPVVSLGLRHPEVAVRIEQGAPLWVIGPNGDAEAQTIVREILGNWRDKPFALLDDGSVYGRNLSDRLRALAEEAGLRPLSVESFRPLQSNQRALLRRLAGTGVEAIFVAGEAEDAATFARDAARVAPNMVVATGEPGALVPFLDPAPPSGLLTVTLPARRDLPSASILVERLENDGFPPDDGILEGYALGQIALALLADRSVAGRTHQTVVGPLRFGPDHRAVATPFERMVWNGTRLITDTEADAASPAE